METASLGEMAAALASALRSVLDGDRDQTAISGATRLAAEEALARYEAEGQPELIAGLLRSCQRVIRVPRATLPEDASQAMAEMRRIVEQVASYAFVPTGKRTR
jgi:hypothetical protein